MQSKRGQKWSVLTVRHFRRLCEAHPRMLWLHIVVGGVSLLPLVSCQGRPKRPSASHGVQQAASPHQPCPLLCRRALSWKSSRSNVRASKRSPGISQKATPVGRSQRGRASATFMVWVGGSTGDHCPSWARLLRILRPGPMVGSASATLSRALCDCLQACMVSVRTTVAT